MSSTFFFYLFAIVLILASLSVVFARNPLYNVLSLVAAIFSISSLFILLEAFFVGMILLLVYAGAVLVFFLFVVMCLNIKPDSTTPFHQSRLQWLGWLTGFLFLSQFFWIVRSTLQAQAIAPSAIRGTIENIGQILFTEYLLPFELTSFLLLIAIFGIVSLTQGAFSTGKDVKS